MVSKKEKEVPRINRAFAALVNANGSQTEAADLLGFRSQDIGYYMRGRKIPPELIAGCRKHYGYDLIDLEQMDFENMVLKKKESFETIVSRETNKTAPDPWGTVTKLVDTFTLSVQEHKREVTGLEKDKEFLQKLVLRYAPDPAPHKTK